MHVPSLFAARRGAVSAVALLLVGLLLAACSSSKKPAAHGSATATPSKGSPPAKTSPSPAVVEAHFVEAGVRAVDDQDRPSSNDAANAAAKKVIELVDSYYNDAFLQPSQWGNGQFPALSGLFTSDAASSVAPNLAVLSLGSLATQLSKVTPTKQNANTVAVLIEPNGQPSYATITTRLEATGTPTAGGGSVTILQSAQFMILATGGTYHIAGYDITSSYSGVSGSARYGGPIGGLT